MRQKLFSLVVVCALLAFIIGLRFFGKFIFFENTVRLITDSALKKMYQASIPKSIRESNPAHNYALCLAEDTKIRILEDENNSLREQLLFFKKNPGQVGAQVIARDLDPLGTTIVIDRGSADGVVVDQAVIVNNGLMIGKIARVEGKTAVVRLISDYESKVAATVLNREKSLGLVEGGYGLAVTLNLIPQNEIIRPGDTIVTSGLEPGIPRGLVVGTVEVISKKPQEPFQQAILKTSADLHNLFLVSVIISS